MAITPGPCNLAEGGLPIDAAPYWLEAAHRSLSRSALTEVSRVLRRGLDALESLPATPPVISLRLQFAALLGPALISLREPNAAETQDLYTEAYELGHLLPEEPAHFPIYLDWWRLDTASEERALALLQCAKSRSDPGLLLQAHHCCWSTYLNRAELDLCCQYVDAGFAIYDEGSYRQHALLYGNHDAKACAHLNLSQALWLQGRLGAALEQEQIGLRWADDMDHLGTRVHARGMALLHQTYRRDYAVVLSQADELTALTSRHGMENAGAAALIFRGWAVAQLGEPLAGIQELEEGWTRQREIATNEDYPVYLCLLAEVLTTLGRAQEAADRIRSELDGFERSQLRIWIPELERVLGDTILAADPANVEEARHHHVRASDFAKFQKVPMLGLRVALSLSRLSLRSAPDQAARFLTSALAKLPKEAAEEGWAGSGRGARVGGTPAAAIGNCGCVDRRLRVQTIGNRVRGCAVVVLRRTTIDSYLVLNWRRQHRTRVGRQMQPERWAWSSDRPRSLKSPVIHHLRSEGSSLLTRKPANTIAPRSGRPTMQLHASTTG